MDEKIKHLAVTIAAINISLTEMYDFIERYAQSQWDLLAGLCAELAELKELNNATGK